jgi:hypothetical protein
MDIPLLFGSYSSAALAPNDKLTAYDMNAGWFHMFDEIARAHIQGNAAGAMPVGEASP